MAHSFGSMALVALVALCGCTAPNPMYDPSALEERAGDGGVAAALDRTELSPDAVSVAEADAGIAAGDSGAKAADARAISDTLQPKTDARTTTSGCRWGTHGDNGDSCRKVPSGTWRCVKSARFGTWISQVCRKGLWQTFRLRRNGCNACCGTYNTACGK